MSLQKGAVSYTFAGGINTKTDEKSVPATQLLALENGVFTRGTSIRKRNGYSALGMAVENSSTALSGLIRLGERDDELLGFTASRCYSYEPTADQWSDTGAVYSLVGADRPIVRTGTEQTMPDHATLSGVSVYAWEDSRGGVWYEVADASTGRIHIASTQADADGISPRCLPVGDVLHIYYADATHGRISVIVVSPAAPEAAVTPAILTDDLNTTDPVYDAVATPITGTPAAIVWHEAGTKNYRLGYVHSSGVLGSPATSLPSVITEANGIDTGQPIALAYSSTLSTLTVLAVPNGATDLTANLYADGVSGGSISLTDSFIAIPSVSAPQRIAATWTAGASPVCWVALEEYAAEPSERYCTIISFVDGSSVIAPRTQLSVGLASRAWAVSGSDEAFVYFLHDTTYFNVYLALRLSDSICVARTLPGLAGDAPARKHLPSAHVIDDVVSIVLPYNERLPSANDDQFAETGIRLVTLDYDDGDSHQHAQLGRGLYLGGACPQHYDGRQWSEQGFHVGPEHITAAKAGGGSLTPSSSYLYRVWYEWTDAQGEIHRGPVSFGTLVTLGGGETQVTLTIPTLRVTQRPNVRIAVARSQSADTGDTAELFRVTSLDPSATGANGYVANDPSSDSVSFIDRMSDTTLATQEPLYTNGGILSTDPSALGHIIARSKGRLFTTDPADPYAVRYSQELEDGYGVEFPPELVLSVDPLGGRVTALADLDGEIVIWQEGAIRAVGGGGPTPTGDTATTGFSDPRLLSTAVGCDDPSSLVLTPDGYVFASDKGLWRLTRAGQVEYVGAAAEAFNAQTTRSADALPGRTSIVFLTDDGTTLLYDYFFGQWSTFTNHLGMDAAVVGGAYYYLRADGRVFRETVGSYSDAGQRITLRLETAWIHVAQALQGFQRFWNLLVLGTWISPHQLGISSRVDYENPGPWTATQWLDATGESSSTGWITGTNADAIGDDPITGTTYGEGEYGDGEYGGDAPDRYQWRYYIGGRGQSVQFRFEDFERDGLTGASFELAEMLIEGGVAGTSAKPFSAARSA